MSRPTLAASGALLLLAVAGCASSPDAAPELPPRPAGSLVASISQPCDPPDDPACGFRGPESVRFDPDQDVWFVANFNGPGNAADDNGFISRLRADGGIERLRWVSGGIGGVTLHAPRGMAIAGDTLWVADVGAVRGFHRRTGAPLATIDFGQQDAGFLNDVAVAADGALLVTDTQRNRVYRIAAGRIAVALEGAALGAPNGITWDGMRSRAIVVPFGGDSAIYGWRPGEALSRIAVLPGARYDGVEVLPSGTILVASQADSSLWLVDDTGARRLARTRGRPADIGVDARRGIVAVPYIALNLVELYALPVPR